MKPNPIHTNKDKPEDLSAEITRLREIIHQVADLAGTNSQPDELLAVLRAMSEGSSRLAILLKTQQELLAKPASGVDPFAELRDALARIQEKLHQEDLEADAHRVGACQAGASKPDPGNQGGR